MSSPSKEYTPAEIEPRWQSYWEEVQLYRAVDGLDKPTYYALDMFPYPSGAGLHIGHPEGYTASDILSRKKWAEGYNVLHPMGWDAFGLPAEQHAISTGVHPAENTRANIENFKSQIKRIGFAVDWSREINTTDPAYYKWTQWIFLRLFQHGLAYVDEKPVWWCPALGTVLANEEVIEGKSERGNHPVERRALRQWMLKITEYADQLLYGLKDLNWPESTKRMQEEWIGRSEGAEIAFPIKDKNETLHVYTTRPDTLFGATYMVVAPEHPVLSAITEQSQRDDVEQYITKAKSKSEIERQADKEKSGAFTGAYAINPVNNKELPVYVGDYVLWGYGSGAIMAVPAHDERDFAFAKKYNLEVIEVIQPPSEKEDNDACYTGDGHLINSGPYDGMDSKTAGSRITEELESHQTGKRAVNYKLRDWLFSRQRYWGEPFPIIYLEEKDYQKLMDLTESPYHEFLPQKPVTYTSGEKTWYAVPLPSDQLPLELPEVESYQPAGEGQSPLANAPDWVYIQVHLKTGETLPASASSSSDEDPLWVPAVRETNTMPQWAGSCWYYLRYLDPENHERFIDPQEENDWKMPDIYIGGAEHAVLHLLYARFWHRFLYDIGELQHPEPFTHLYHQGIILGEDGQKMSKSRGNVINPDSIISEYGADALRLFEMFLGPLDAMKPWNTGGIEGIARYLRKVWRLYIQEEGHLSPNISPSSEADAELLRLYHETIRKVTEDIDALRMNTAISQLMVCANHLQKANSIPYDMAKGYLQLLAPFAPHVAEELWFRLGEAPSVIHAKWPEYDPDKLEQSEAKIALQVSGKVRGEMTLPKNIDKEEAIQRAKEHEKMKPHLEGKQVVKEIYVPEKIINIVAK